jgi:Zn ribbon nucleic-acid-binding protein
MLSMSKHKSGAPCPKCQEKGLPYWMELWITGPKKSRYGDEWIPYFDLRLECTNCGLKMKGSVSEHE